MALLSVVASMVLELTVRVSAALWGSRIINSLIGNNTEGLNSAAMQQGGIGLLLSILVVSLPPMASMFFQGTLGSALTYSVFQGAGGRPGPQGQPAGSASWADHKISAPPGEKAVSAAQQQSAAQGFSTRVSGAPAPVQSDAIKQGPNRQQT